jgi:hypothetical protein
MFFLFMAAGGGRKVTHLLLLRWCVGIPHATSGDEGGTLLYVSLPGNHTLMAREMDEVFFPQKVRFASPKTKMGKNEK